MSSPHRSAVDSSDESPTKNTSRRPRKKWSQKETAALVEGLSRHGPGKWSSILSDYEHIFHERNAVDLKDKYVNLKKSTFAHPQGRSTNIFQNGYQIYKIVDVKTEMDQTYFKVSDNANHGWIASHQPPPENVIYNDEKWDQLISDYISSLKQKLVHAERGLLQALDSENLTPVVFSETPTFEVQQQEFIPQSLNSQVSLASGKNVQTEDIFAVKSSGADRTRNTLAFTSPSKTTPPLNAASVSTLGTSAMRKDRHRDVPSSIPPQKRLKLKSVSFNVDSSGSESSSSASSSETLFDRENEEVNTIETTVSFNRGSRSCLLM